MLKTLCVLFFLSIHSLSKGQIVYKGLIVDSSNIPIERASIQVKDATTNSLLQVIVSDNKGAFTYTAKTNTVDIRYKLTVSHISFKRLELEIDGKIWKGETATIVLGATAQTSLKEVVIKSTPITNSNDTTTYRIKSFVDGTEKTLEDVAKKLPGLVVNDDGSMTFKGKRLSKILIEGEDLLSNKTKLLSKNFPADLLDNIQLVENYNDNKVLRGFNQGDQTIMNLKLNKRKFEVAFGEIGVSLGNASRQDYSLVLFSLLNKMKSATLANHNNIGKDNIQVAGLSIDGDEAIKKISNFNYQNIVNLPDNIISPNRISLPLPTQRWFFNRQTNASHQSNFTLSKKVKTKALINFQNDNSRIDFNRIATFYQQSLNISVFDSTQTINKPFKLKLNLNTDVDISETKQLRLLLQFDANKDAFASNQINKQLGIRSINNGQLNNNIYNAFVLADYASRINDDKIVLINTYFNAKWIDQYYHLVSNNFSPSLINLGTYDAATQNYNIQNMSTGTQIQLLKKRNNVVNTHYFDFQVQTNNRNNNLLLKNTIGKDSIYLPSQQRDKNTMASLLGGYKNTFKKNKSRLTSLVEVGIVSWTNQAASSRKSRNGLSFNIESTLQHKFTSKFTASISSSYQRIYNNNHLINDSFALISNNELMRYSTVDLFRSKWDINYSVYYISQKLSVFTLNGGYSYSPNGFVASNAFVSSVNFVENNFYARPNATTFLSAQNKTPILKLKSRLELAANFLHQKLPYIEQQNLFSTFNNSNLNAEIKYVTVFKTKVNGDIGTKYVTSFSKRKQNDVVLSKVKNISIINQARLIYKYKKQNSISVFYNNYNLNINNQPLRINFLDAELNYYFEKKRIQVDVIFKNLLNNTSYNQFNISPLFQNNTNYFLFGRSVDVSVKLKL